MPYIFGWFLFRPGHTTFARVVGLGWLGIFLFAAMINSQTADKHPVVAPINPKLFSLLDDNQRIEQVSEIVRNLNEISTTQAEIVELLKTHYPNSTQSYQLRKHVESIEAWLGVFDTTSPQIAPIHARLQASLLASEILVRKVEAKTLELHFIDTGINATVTTSGKNATILTVQYGLASKTFAHHTGNELAKRMAKIGFTRIVITNGFSSALRRTFTYDL